MSYYKQQLKDWLKDKDFVSDKVLSVGNMNDDCKYFKSFKANEMMTIDNDPRYNPDILGDMNKYECDRNGKGENDWLNKKFLTKKEYFDDLFTFELWEYIYNPQVCLSNCNFLLKKGGRLWISAPFIYPTHSPKDYDYLRYTEFFWRKVLPEFGFEILEYQQRIWKDSSGYWESVNIDGMRPAKDYKHNNLTGHLIIAKKI